MMYFLLLAFGLPFVVAVKSKSVELVYDTEAASLGDGVQKYVSISGCFYKCTNADCEVLEGGNENFCMIIATVLASKNGNLREGHFNGKYYSELPDDRGNAGCESEYYGGYGDFESDYQSAEHGPITGYKMWHNPYMAGIQIRYGNIWGTPFGLTNYMPTCYMQFANDEKVTTTRALFGGWIDNMKIITSHREYPNFGLDNTHYVTATGREMRYIGAGYSLLAAHYYNARFVSGLKVYFIC